MTTERITASTKVRILKPFDRDWNDVGPRLRDLAWLGHRVLNGTMTRLAISAELPDLAPESWKTKKNETSEKRPGGKLNAYRMTAEAIRVANESRVQVRLCAWCNGSGVEPNAPPVNKRGKPIVVTKAQLKRERIAGQVCARCDGAREYRVGEAVDVPSAIQAGWQRMADRRFANDRTDMLKGAKSLASYRSPAPIAVTSSGEAFLLRKEGRDYLLDAPLYPGGAVGRVTFVLAPDGPNAYAHLRRMLEPGSKLGDLKILSADKKWLAVISYSWEREVPTARAGSDAIVRMNADGSPELVIQGRSPKRLYEGMSIDRKRRIFSLRRTSRSRHQRDIGAGARGHGRARALEHYHAVDDAESRWMQSICQEIAAKAVREADKRGARWVKLDEKFTALPPAKLTNAIEWALQKAGFVQPQDLVPSESDLARGKEAAS